MPAAKKPKGTPPSPARPHGLNVRQARFAELVASGMKAAPAYREAGYEPKGHGAAEAGACRMLKDGKVATYLAELRAKQTDSAIRTKDQNLRYLSDLLTTPIEEVGPDSLFCVEYTEDLVAGGNHGKLKRGQEPSGNEIETPAIIRRKVKKADPLRALEIFNRMRGHYEPDRSEIDLGNKTLLSITERALGIASGLVSSYGTPEDSDDSEGHQSDENDA